MSCLKFIKYIMCVVNLIFFISGASIFGFGIYMMVNFKFVSLIPTLAELNIASMLFIIGIIITCVSFLGFLGALKENRCLLISFFIILFILMLAEFVFACVLLFFENQVDRFIMVDMEKSLNASIIARRNKQTEDDWDLLQSKMKCCGLQNVTDWGEKIPDSCCKTNPCQHPKQFYIQGCYNKAKRFFEENLLNTGIGVIVVCSIEVLGMCFAMTLFCHISRSGMGFK